MPGQPSATGGNQIAAMDEIGVDAAIVVSPWHNYRYDSSYGADVCRAYPSRFRLVTPIDPYDSAAAEQVTEAAQALGAVGIRLFPGDAFDAGLGSASFKASDRDVAKTIHAAVLQALPVCIFCSETSGITPDTVGDLARLYPDAQLVLDHLGLIRPFTPSPSEWYFSQLDSVLALAQYPNVAIKVSHVCELSHEPYPFEDIWEPLGRVFETFGIDRCMWASDWTVTADVVSYRDCVSAFRDRSQLSAGDRAALMGETLQRIYTWDAALS